MINRKEVYNKYGGRCAYCGQKITVKQMQVDHIIAQRHYKNGIVWLKYWYNIDVVPDIDDISNLMPTCHICNNFKSAMTLKELRDQLFKQVERIRSSQFNRALKYGQIKITRSPIWFYFEKVELAEWFRI